MDPHTRGAVPHGEFFDAVKFTEVVKLPSAVENIIHQIYRIDYLRNNVLHNVINDDTNTTLSDMGKQKLYQVLLSISDRKVISTMYL